MRNCGAHYHCRQIETQQYVRWRTYGRYLFRQAENHQFHDRQRQILEYRPTSAQRESVIGNAYLPSIANGHYRQKLAQEIPNLQRNFHKLMSRELVRERGVMLLPGSMSAEERLAVFLLGLSQRFAARGYSPSEFNLRMTREEIGTYLGLKLETVSRTFSQFQEEGLIGVYQKSVRILDSGSLKRVVGREHT